MLAATVTSALRRRGFSLLQWFASSVSALEALDFQPEGLANASAEGWWPQRGDVFPGPTFLADDAACLTLVRAVIQLRCFEIVSRGCGLLSCVECGVSSMEYGFRQSSIPSVSSHSPSLLMIRYENAKKSTQ